MTKAMKQQIIKFAVDKGWYPDASDEVDVTDSDTSAASSSDPASSSDSDADSAASSSEGGSVVDLISTGVRVVGEGLRQFGQTISSYIPSSDSESSSDESDEPSPQVVVPSDTSSDSDSQVVDESEILPHSRDQQTVQPQLPKTPSPATTEDPSSESDNSNPDLEEDLDTTQMIDELYDEINDGQSDYPSDNDDNNEETDGGPDCVPSTRKKYHEQARISPPIPAKDCRPGTVKQGRDGNMWVATRDSNGNNRWQRKKTNQPTTFPCSTTCVQQPSRSNNNPVQRILRRQSQTTVILQRLATTIFLN